MSGIARRPQRTLIYADSRDFGGSERFVVELVNNLDRDRFTPIVLASERLASHERMRAAGVECVSVPVRGVEDSRLVRRRPRRSDASQPTNPITSGETYRERRPWVIAGGAAIRYEQAVRNLRVLRRVLRRLSPDLIHVNNGNYPGAESSRLVALAARSAGGDPAVLQFVHGIPEGPRWPADAERALDGRVDEATDLWVTGAHAATTALSASRGFPLYKIRTVYLGQPTGSVPTSAEREQARRSLELPADAFVLLTVGALLRGKGHATLLDALSSAPGAHWLVAGSGPEEQELRRSAGHDARVHFLGWRDDVPTLMAASDVLVHPSIGMEQMPFAIKEAMARGLPVVATSVGGVPELVTDDQTGLLVSPGDASALAHALGRLDDAELRARLGRAGRERIGAAFDPQQAVASVESLYQELLDKRGARPGVANS